VLLFCIGTRPEAIKLAPLVLLAKARGYDARILSTGQHREMLYPILSFFGLTPDFDLSVLQEGQTLADLASAILSKSSEVMATLQPKIVFVQGDTTTAFACGLSAFFAKIPVAHVEAGLRTGERYSPFPEEMNRSLLGSIATFHFSPTESAKENLRLENITENVWVTGNTGIDALRITNTLQAADHSPPPDLKTILVTCHRRETHGAPLIEICDALLALVNTHDDIKVIFPVHLNPNVQSVVYQTLGNHPRIKLIPPVNYADFSNLMKECFIILTDSGGIQEEAPYFKKPIFVLRDSTERPEGIAAKVAELVGSNKSVILEKVNRILADPSYYESFQHSKNPYGDGFASEKILDFLKPFLNP
jgi:UDP-N-acetylglucosamine 2-epimerase (non-hydrolysing)